MLADVELKTIRRSLEGSADRMAVICNALGDRGRLKIFRLLMERHDLCVTDVARILGTTVSAASQQFRILEMVGLLVKERKGQMACYKIRDEDPFVRSVMSFISEAA